MDRILHQKVVGIRKQISFALHKAAGHLLRHILPEPILREIAVIGLVQELLRSTQASLLHLLCDRLCGGPLREGQAHRLRFCILGQGIHQVNIRPPGIQRKGAVLQTAGGIRVFDIVAEQQRRANDPLLLELVCNGRHTAAFFNGDGHCTAGSPLAMDLGPGGQHSCPCSQEQHHQQDQQHFGCSCFFPRLRMGLFLCHMHLPLFSVPSSAACSSRSHQTALHQSGSSRSPDGCLLPKTESGQRPR